MTKIQNVERNLTTQFYVTDDCNGFGLCRNLAPDFFDYVEYAYSYFITHQPRTESEVALLRDAQELCVLDAIRETADQVGERIA